MGTRFRWATAVAVGLFAGIVCAAGPAPGIEATAEPIPGVLDVLQGTAVKLDANLPPEGPTPSSYRWVVVQGDGGQLFGNDQADAVFLAPKIDMPQTLFVVELTVGYAELPSSTVRLHLRVHRQSADAQPAPAPAEDDTAWLDDFYRKAKNDEIIKEASRPSVVAPSSSSGPRVSIGWSSYGGMGVGIGWQWHMSYPIAVPVEVPAPGTTRSPGDAGWATPRLVSYDEVVTTFPEQIADGYLPRPAPWGGNASLAAPAGGFARKPGTTGASRPAVDPTSSVDPLGF